MKKTVSDWLYENDEVYKDLFDLKRQGWQNRSHDTRNYSIDSRRKDLEALHQCTLEGIERNPDVFYPSANKRFLDIGGAPDVTNNHLDENLYWSGFAVSMPTHWGGRNMEFKNELKCELNIGAADAYDRLSNWLDQRGATQFDFVNMGVITPYKGDNPVREEDRAMFDVRTQNNGEALHAVYRNSMCVALERLKERGSVKWTLREPNLAELFRMLDILAQLFDEVRYVPCGRRAPFDLLCVGFRREKAQPVLEVIKRQSVPLSVQDNSFWMCEREEEAVGIYEKHKALLHVIWTKRKEILAVALT